MKLSDVKVSGLFKVAGIEFIKFAQDGNRTVAVAKDSLFNSAFGDDNNFAKSKILKRLQEEVLPKIEAEVGAEKLKKQAEDFKKISSEYIEQNRALAEANYIISKEIDYFKRVTNFESADGTEAR